MSELRSLVSHGCIASKPIPVMSAETTLRRLMLSLKLDRRRSADSFLRESIPGLVDLNYHLWFSSRCHWPRLPARTREFRPSEPRRGFVGAPSCAYSRL